MGVGKDWRFFFFFQAEEGIGDADVTGVQTCALPISGAGRHRITEPLEPLRHQPAGAPLLEPQLGVLVQVAARGDQARAVDGGESHECRLYDATLYAIRALQRSVVTSYDGSYPRARAQSVDDALLAL